MTKSIQLFNLLNDFQGYSNGDTNEAEVTKAMRELARIYPAISTLTPTDKYREHGASVSLLIQWSRSASFNFKPTHLFILADGRITFNRYSSMPYYRKAIAHLTAALS